MINLDFLNSFSARMNVIAPANVFFVKVANSVRFNEYITSEELLNISWAGICYLHEKTLTKEGISLSDMARFIEIICLEMYDKDLGVVSKEIAKFLLLEVGLNEGNLLEIKTYDFEKRASIKKTIKLIDDYIGASGENRYKLSNQGSDFLFRTNEVEQHLQISMKQIYTKELIKRREFNQAYNVARELLEDCLYQVQSIEAFMFRLKTNILNVDVGEYGKIIDEIFKTIEEQKEEYDIILDMIKECEEEFRRLGYYDKKVEGFKRVKELLECIIKEHDNVYLKRFEISDVYEEAIHNLMEVSMNKRYDIREDILGPIISGVDMSNLFSLLTPLLGVKQPRYININDLYKPQLIIEENEEDAETEYKTLEEDTAAIEKANKEKESIQKLYIEIVENLIEFGISRRGSVYTVSEFINELKIKKSKILKSKNLTVFFKVITVLYGNEVDERENILSNAKELDVTFNLASVLKKVAEMNPVYRDVRSISVYMGENEFTYTQIATKGDESIEEIYEITDFEIKIDLMEGTKLCIKKKMC